MKNFALDLLVLPLVVIHCAVVFVVLCLFMYGWDYVSYAPTIDRQVSSSVAWFMLFGVPILLALALAWLNFRFILGKIARTEAVRAAIAIFLFAFAAPVLMIPVDIVIGCVVTSAKVGKSICL